jgi:hypothetical protein
MPERSDAPLADEPQGGAIPNDMPSGMPEGVEDQPLGTPGESDPDGEGETARGEDAQPGMPQGDEPVSDG